MKNKKLCMGMLAIALVFEMMVVGCGDGESSKETNPSPPTGLSGIAISSTSVQLSWNSVSNVDEYWINYKNTNTGIPYHKEGIKSTSYIITDLVPATEYDFQVAVRNKDHYVSKYSTAISVETLPPTIINVSISYLRTESMYISGSYGGYAYTIAISLKLSEGAYWDSVPSEITAKPWITVSGVTLSSWNFQSGLGWDKDTLQFSYTIAGQSSPISIPSGITVSIDQTKLVGMKEYTNVTDSLTLGSPSSASSSAWTEL